MSVKKLVWTTDVHLNFLSIYQLEKFISSVQTASPDIMLIGGDIAEANNVAAYLKRLEQAVDAQIYIVLGNHDFYGGSMFQVKEDIRKIVKESDRLFYLDDLSHIELSKDAALFGHSSWADGRLGDYNNSQVMLNDYYLIRDFMGCTKSERYAKLNNLGNQAATKLKADLETAVHHYRHLYCLTHVPPFRDACWHDGKISNDDYLPHFACKVVGDVLQSIMAKHPEVHLTVLCGHTHSSGKANILNNLEVITGEATYGEPRIQQEICL
jgi:Icc-related predicted phosphoesterase